MGKSRVHSKIQREYGYLYHKVQEAACAIEILVSKMLIASINMEYLQCMAARNSIFNSRRQGSE